MSFRSAAEESAFCRSTTAYTITGTALSNGIYGGDYTNEDPTTSTDGFGKCDFAVDLGGTQDDNGLYRKATVWVGSDYAANIQGAIYFFSAVAIAGKLDGKYAVFLIGADSTQPWAVYLLQSN